MLVVFRQQFKFVIVYIHIRPVLRPTLAGGVHILLAADILFRRTGTEIRIVVLESVMSLCPLRTGRSRWKTIIVASTLHVDRLAGQLHFMPETSWLSIQDHKHRDMVISARLAVAVLSERLRVPEGSRVGALAPEATVGGEVVPTGERT